MSRLQNDMFACGKAQLPHSITCNNLQYSLETIFKHDFFACTGRYVCPTDGQRVVLKISRIRPFFGIPLHWLGHYLRNREVKLLSSLQNIQFVPKLLGTFGRNGMIYRYIEGSSLDDKPKVGDLFFAELEKLLDDLHARNICYMDLNKRGNILLGTDGHPYLIDFQISLRLDGGFFAALRKALQNEDKYHLLKQKRRLRPDLLTEQERTCSRRPSFLIKVHRLISFPYRQSRRWLLKMLYKNNLLSAELSGSRTPENDASRFLK